MGGINTSKIHEEYKAAGFSDEQVRLACHVLNDALLLVEKETRVLKCIVEQLSAIVDTIVETAADNCKQTGTPPQGS